MTQSAVDPRDALTRILVSTPGRHVTRGSSSTLDDNGLTICGLCRIAGPASTEMRPPDSFEAALLG